MADDRKVILVTGATGKQGGGVVRSILESPQGEQKFIIGAVTRDANSKSAQSLAAKSTAIKIIQGSLSDCPALLKTARDVTSQPIWGVYSVQVPGKEEEKQGKDLVDASIAAGVKKFVYSSVERGGDEKSWTNPTPIPHFISKHNVELYLREKAQGTGMDWTILRPVAFMDNWSPGFGHKVFATALKGTLPDDKTLQWISCKDIGYFAAQAFINPQEYSQKAIGLAGDELTFSQLSDAFKNVTGSPIGTTYGFFGAALKKFAGDMGTMLDWFKTDGYAIDIAALRKKHSGLQDMETWLREESKFPKK